MSENYLRRRSAQRLSSGLIVTFRRDITASARASAFAGNDAPLIGERAATRGRSATKGGDAHTGIEHVIRSSASLVESARPRRKTLPGTRTLVDLAVTACVSPEAKTVRLPCGVACYHRPMVLKGLSSAQKVGLVFAAVLYIVAGTLHFIKPRNM